MEESYEKAPEDMGTSVPTSFASRTVKGSAWILSLRLTNRALGLIRTIILARLLLPEHFGILGIAAVTISTLETFSQPGIATALVQKRDGVEDYLDTAWTVSVLRCLILFGLLYWAAPFVAGFFDTPRAEIVLQVFAVSVIIAGCRNIGVIFFQRDLDFRKQYVYEFSVTLGNMAVAVPAAFILRNVWALVIGGIAGSMVRFMMSYVLHSYRPRIRFDRERFGELFGFGKWVLWSSALVFLVTQGDDIFLGKMFGATALGFYQMAYMISNLPTTEVSQVVSHVTFPAYSKIQDDTGRFGEAYLKVLQLISFIAVPLAGAIFILAPELVELVLSEKWMPVVPMIQILVWAGLIRAFMDTTVPVFNAAGKPRIHTKWQLINLLALGLSIYPLSLLWGVMGVSLAVFLGNAAAASGELYETGRILRYNSGRFAKITLFPLAGMLLSVIVVLWLKTVIPPDSLLGLGVHVISGIVSYFFVIFIFDGLFEYNMFGILKESIVSLRTSER